MIRQLGVELRRALHRRALWVVLGIGVAVLVAVGASVFASSAPGGPGPGGEALADFADGTFCPSRVITTYSGPDVDPFVVTCPDRPPESVPKVLLTGDVGSEPYFPWNGSFAVMAAVFLVVVFLVAATLVGAEFRHGTVETALVAEPRRARLLALRLVAVTIVGVSLWLLLAVGYLLVLAPSVLARAITDTHLDWVQLVPALGRGVVAAALVSLLAGALAAVGRGTVVAAFALVGAGVLAGLAFGRLRLVAPVDLLTNMWAVLTGGDGLEYVRQQETYGVPGATFTVDTWVLRAGWPWVGAVAVVGAWTTVALGAAFATFLRRDVR